ncbi:hypothetical protein [Arthrobacter sp. NPDC090010]|uniref:hypothetical protein n=1 Tax=Arthrobacter sp. NPDC090010 TaxID=3363942 RepID=UPI00380B9F00
MGKWWKRNSFEVDSGVAELAVSSEIAASRGTVWQLISDPEYASLCDPGVLHAAWIPGTSRGVGEMHVQVLKRHGREYSSVSVIVELVPEQWVLLRGWGTVNPEDRYFQRLTTTECGTLLEAGIRGGSGSREWDRAMTPQRSHELEHLQNYVDRVKEVLESGWTPPPPPRVVT